MKKLANAVDMRLKEINEPQQTEEHMKPFSLRMPLELIEKLDGVAPALELKRTDLARMILENGVDDIIEHLGLEFGRNGASFAEMYALETGEITLPELMKKWEAEREDEVGDKQ